MDKPSTVNQAVFAILLTLVISAFLALYQKMAGHSSNGEFIFTIVIYSFLCILPYKINNKSNAARYAYLVITVASVFLMIGGDFEKYKLEYIVSLTLIPIEIFIIYRLFQPETSNWFKS